MSQRSDVNRSARRGASAFTSNADIVTTPSPQYGNQRYEEPSRHRDSTIPSWARSSSPVDGQEGTSQEEYLTGEGFFSTQSVDALKELISRRSPCRDCEERAEKPSKRRKTCSLTQPGRGIRKVIDLYHDIDDLVDKARKLDARSIIASQEGDTARSDFAGLNPDEIEEEKKDRERCHKALQLLNRLIPGFEQNAIASGNICAFCSPLQSGANDARSDDTSRLKVAVADWLNSRTPLTTGPSARISSKSKEDRGINNDVTGRLLCPIDFNWDDPQVRAKLRNYAPGYDINSSLFLRCLYEGEDGDPQSPQVGFLKGPLLLRAFRHIFTSPSSAGDEDTTTEVTSRRRDVATTLRLNGHVTARSIAYTATQLVFSLNSAREWKVEHAGFHYPAFYNFVVDVLEDEDETTRFVNVSELFQWWNSKVFPPSNKVNHGGSSRNANKSCLARLRQAQARDRVERRAF